MIDAMFLIFLLEVIWYRLHLDRYDPLILLKWRIKSEII